MKRRKPFKKINKAVGGRVTNPVQKPGILITDRDNLDCRKVETNPIKGGEYTIREGCVPIDPSGVSVAPIPGSPKPNVSIVECRTDRECPRGMRCFRGSCIFNNVESLDCRNDRDCNPNEVCERGNCIPQLILDPVIIDNIEQLPYECNGGCTESPGYPNWTCDNPNNANFGQTVNNINQCYSTVIMPDGKEWFTENLSQLRVHDGFVNSDSTVGTYILYDEEQWESGTPFAKLTNWEDRDNTVYYTGWTPVEFGQENFRSNVCPPGFYVPSVEDWERLFDSVAGEVDSGRNPQDVGAALKESGACIAGECDSDGDGNIDIYWYFAGSPQNEGIDTYGFSARGYGYIDIPGDALGFFEDAYFWSSTKYGQESKSYFTKFMNGTRTATLGYDDGQLDKGFNIRCVKGDYSEVDDTTIQSWWEKMEDHVYGERFSETGNTWYPAEVCINDPYIICDDIEARMSEITGIPNFSLKQPQNPLVHQNRQNGSRTRLECPAGPIYFDTATGDTHNFGTTNIGQNPSGCMRDNYVGDIDFGQDYQGNPVDDIGCCDSIDTAYGLQRIYEADSGFLHNCFYLDGDWKYMCGGCSCPWTPNGFAVSIPAWHYYNDTSEIPDNYASYYGNAPSGMTYATPGNTGSHLSLGPSCPDRMCVGGTYNGMYSTNGDDVPDNIWSVTDTDCISGDGMPMEGSGCSWGFKNVDGYGLYTASGWNGTDYSCCPGCSTFDSETSDLSCQNIYSPVKSNEFNWAVDAWNPSMHSYGGGAGVGEEWYLSDATFEQWVKGICGIYGAEYCFPQIDCSQWDGNPADCGEWEIYDANINPNDDEGSHCYYPNDGISPGGCCGFDYISNKCVYKGCQVYQDCYDSYVNYFGLNTCVDNCQSPETLSYVGDLSDSQISHYPLIDGLTDEQFYLCSPDSDGDNICDGGDTDFTGDGTGDASTCFYNNFDCNNDCCDPNADSFSGAANSCAVEDQCGQCTLGQGTLPNGDVNGTGLAYNNWDNGCGCYFQSGQGPTPQTYYEDQDGDGQGDPNSTAEYCFQGGSDCENYDSCYGLTITDNTNYLADPQSCGEVGGWCSSGTDFTDPDEMPDTGDEIYQGECPCNTMHMGYCNSYGGVGNDITPDGIPTGCCIPPEGYPVGDECTLANGYTLCGTTDVCGNCMQDSLLDADVCSGTVGSSLNCGDAIVQGETDLNGNIVRDAGCDYQCCGSGNDYSDCASESTFYLDIDGDGHGGDTSAELCSDVNGVFAGPDSGTIGCGQLNGYCPNSDDLDDECYCPANDDSCTDCKGDCVPRTWPTGLTECPDGINQVLGCAYFDPNGFSGATGGECPENWCVGGSTEGTWVDECKLGCNGIYYKDGADELQCPGVGAVDDCGVCGGTCCENIAFGDGCQECGCDTVAERYGDGFVGDTTPGNHCDCAGNVANDCGECGGQEFYNCLDDSSGCDQSQLFCPEGTVNPNNRIMSTDCSQLDDCGVCGGPGPQQCPSGTNPGERCSTPVGGTTISYCPTAHGGYGDLTSCPVIDGCGECYPVGEGAPAGGYLCINYTGSANNDTGTIETDVCVVTPGDYCSEVETFCPNNSADTGNVGFNCVTTYDCIGNCPDLSDGAVIDDCCQCTGPGTDCEGSECTFNYLDNGCGCDVDGPSTYFFDYDGDTLPDPDGSPYYNTALYCFSEGNPRPSSQYTTVPVGSECGNTEGWCVDDGDISWDVGEDFYDLGTLELYSCPCNKRDCFGNCCIDAGVNSGACIDSGNGWTGPGAQSGGYCAVPDACGICGGDGSDDEGCGCFNGPELLYYPDPDGDGLGEADGNQDYYCPADAPEGWSLSASDPQPGCYSNTYDCSGVCEPNEASAIVNQQHTCQCGYNSDGYISEGCSDTYLGCAVFDRCGDCTGGGTGLEPCTPDCSSTEQECSETGGTWFDGECWGGLKLKDDCGYCCNPAIDGDCNSQKDCNGNCPNCGCISAGTCSDGTPGGGDCYGGEYLGAGDAGIDSCGICGGNNYRDNCIGNDDCTVMDCWGTCYGDSFLDDCQDCACNPGDACFNTLSGTNTHEVNQDDLGCGCDEPGPNGCNDCNQEIIDSGCGCGEEGPVTHYWDTDGDGWPSTTAHSGVPPQDFCLVHGSYFDPAVTTIGLVYCEPGNCLTCGNIPGWCTWDANDGWDPYPDCPCNETHCNSGDEADCCGCQTTEVDYGDCMIQDCCGNCGGGCFGEGGYGDCTGEITCTNPFDGWVNTLVPGCDWSQTGECHPAGTEPLFDCTGNCTTTPCSPNEIIIGNEVQPAECEECGCTNVVDECCTGDECVNDGNIHYMGSTTEGGYCDCLCKVVDACGNCGGTCEASEDGYITCAESEEFNIIIADCQGNCCSDGNGNAIECPYKINDCLDCVEGGISGQIYNCEDDWSLGGGTGTCGGSNLCMSDLSSCTAPDACGNCGGTCINISDDSINYFRAEMGSGGKINIYGRLDQPIADWEYFITVANGDFIFEMGTHICDAPAPDGGSCDNTSIVANQVDSTTFKVFSNIGNNPIDSTGGQEILIMRLQTTGDATPGTITGQAWQLPNQNGQVYELNYEEGDFVVCEGYSINNEVIAGCDGICSCQGPTLDENNPSVDGTCHRIDHCGFCSPSEGTDAYQEGCAACGDVNDGVYCDYDGTHFYCPAGGVGEGDCNPLSNCPTIDACGVCNGGYNGPNPPINVGSPCTMDMSEGDVCNCQEGSLGVCDRCGICGGQGDFCEGVPQDSCTGVEDGLTYSACNASRYIGSFTLGTTTPNGIQCYYWDTDPDDACIYPNTTYQECPYGERTCYQDTDADCDWNLGARYVLDCTDDRPNGAPETCGDNNDCMSCTSGCASDPSVAMCGDVVYGGEIIYNIPCSVNQTTSSGCRDNTSTGTNGPFDNNSDGWGDGACNYNAWADTDDGSCGYPGDEGFACYNWARDCGPTNINIGASQHNQGGYVQQCTLGDMTYTDWNTHPNGNHTPVDGNGNPINVQIWDSWCFDKADDSCPCEYGPASVRYDCEEVMGLNCWYQLRDETGGGNEEDVVGLYIGCSYYDNGYFNIPCKQVQSCEYWGSECRTNADGTYQNTNSEVSLGCDMSVNGCFDTINEVCSCELGPDQTYTDPSTCPAGCVGDGGYFPNWTPCGVDAQDQSNSCPSAGNLTYPMPTCEDLLGAGACGGTATTCDNSDDHCWMPNEDCDCTDPRDSIHYQCTDLVGCGQTGCHMENPCIDPLPCDQYAGGQIPCNPVGSDTASDCYAGGCFASNCSSGECVAPGAVDWECASGCGPSYACQEFSPCIAPNCSGQYQCDDGTEVCDNSDNQCWSPSDDNCDCDDPRGSIYYECASGCGTSACTTTGNPCDSVGCPGGFACDAGTQVCDNSDSQCFNPVQGCDCEDGIGAVYHHCLVGCGASGCYPAGTTYESVCETPGPCTEYNTGGCSQGTALDCHGNGCVRGLVDSNCCDEAEIAYDSGDVYDGFSYFDCEFECNSEGDSGCYEFDPCQGPYSCSSQGYQCTRVGNGGADPDTPASDCDYQDSCFNIEQELWEHHGCRCTHGPNAQECNMGQCELRCSDLNQYQCGLVDICDGANSTPAQGFVCWSINQYRDYLTDYECSLVTAGGGGNPSSGGGVGPDQLADPYNQGLFAGTCPAGQVWGGNALGCVDDFSSSGLS